MHRRAHSGSREYEYYCGAGQCDHRILMATSAHYNLTSVLRLVDWREPIGQRLHEPDDRALLCIRQAQIPDVVLVHVVGRLRWRPACRTFAGVMRPAARQDVARVIEMDD